MKDISALFHEVKLSRIEIPPVRLRQLRVEKINELAESIDQQGLLQPILVRMKAAGGYELVAGWHRLEAVRKLGHTSIRVGVMKNLDADHVLLAEIDENLIRAELSPAELTLHLSRRKELYEKFHPETKHGGDRKSDARSNRRNGDLKRFTKDTAKKTGRSERTIQRAAFRARKVVVLPQIIGTSLDKGDEMDALASLPEEEQLELASQAQAGEKVTAQKTVLDWPKMELEKVMVLIRNLGTLVDGEVPSTLTARETRKFCADLDNAIAHLHALKTKIFAAATNATKH